MSSIKGTVQAHDVRKVKLTDSTIHEYSGSDQYGYRDADLFLSRDLVIEYADGSTFTIKMFSRADGFPVEIDDRLVDTTSDEYRAWMDGDTDDKPVERRATRVSA